MKPRFFAALTFSIAALLSGCTDDKCEGDGPVFTTEEMQWLPEPGPTAKVRYKTAAGDTLYLRAERNIINPKAYTGKGGNTTCPDEQAATGTYSLLRKFMPGNSAAFQFEVSQEKRKTTFSRRFSFQVPNGFAYSFPHFTGSIDSVVINGTSYHQVELFDATRYNDSLHLTGGNHLKKLYFKKGIGVIGCEYVLSGSPIFWNLD
jgi:hypothetical protein